MSISISADAALRKQKGFTLIEIMVVVAIIGLLAAIALPSYKEYVDKAKRAEVMAMLLEAAQALERNYTLNGSYLNGGALAAVFPTRAPATGTANYTIAVEGTPTSSTFVLKATRAGSMSSDACGDYLIDQAGTRALSGASKSVAECW